MAIIIWIIIIALIVAVTSPGFFGFLLCALFGALVFYLLMSALKSAFTGRADRRAETRRLQEIARIQEEQRQRAESDRRDREKRFREDVLDYCSRFGLQFVELQDDILTTLQTLSPQETIRVTARVASDPNGQIIFKEWIRTEII